MHYVLGTGTEWLRRNGVALTVNKVQTAVLGCNLKNDRMISVCFQGKPFIITVIQGQYSHMDVRVGQWRKLSAEELMLLNCGVGEDSRVPWTARRSNQSILKEISPGCSLEGMMLKLKLQYFGHLMRRVDSLERPWCWKWLEAGGEGDDRGWDGWMASLTPWTWVWVDSRSWWWTGRPGMLQFMGHKESNTTEWLNWNWNPSQCPNQ